jgi:hypothetical protein
MLYCSISLDIHVAWMLAMLVNDNVRTLSLWLMLLSAYNCSEYIHIQQLCVHASVHYCQRCEKPGTDGYKGLYMCMPNRHSAEQYDNLQHLLRDGLFCSRGMEAQVAEYLKAGASADDRKAVLAAVSKALVEKRAAILDVVRTAASDLTDQNASLFSLGLLLTRRSRRCRAAWLAMMQTCD